MLYVSFGLQKAGSTLTANLTRLILERGGHQHISFSPEERADRRRNGSLRVQGDQINNINHWLPEVVHRIDQRVPAERIVLLRTHAAPDATIKAVIRDGRARCHLAIRDLRDIALSMLDVVDRRAQLGKANSSAIRQGEVHSTFPAIEADLTSLAQWDEIPGAIALDYEETAFRPPVSIAAICRHLALDLPVEEYDSLFQQAAANPSGKMNVAMPNRHRREMSADDQAAFLSHFHDFYARYYPDAKVVAEAGQLRVEGYEAEREEKRRLKREEKRKEKLAAKGKA